MPYITKQKKLRCRICGDTKNISNFMIWKREGLPYCKSVCKTCNCRICGEQRLSKLKPIESLPSEVWINLFEGKFKFSNFGRIISLLRPYRPYLISPTANKTGYYAYSFSVNGNIFRKSIHRLLAIHFIPNPHNYPTVNHINGIKTDNSLGNLEWCTYAYNNEHARLKGLNRGKQHKKSGTFINN